MLRVAGQWVVCAKKAASVRGVWTKLCRAQVCRPRWVTGGRLKTLDLKTFPKTTGAHTHLGAALTVG